MRLEKRSGKLIAALMLIALCFGAVAAQENNGDKDKKQKKEKQKQQDARPITIPISVSQGEVRTNAVRGELIELGNITVKENGEVREILNLRSTASSPLHFAVLIQEDLATQVNLELKGIANFIRNLPAGSRVMVAYMRGGTLDVRQRFTEDLERAAKSLRVISGSGANAPFNPYVGVIEGLQRFDNLPTGRRAMLVISDGLDASRGVDSASPAQSIDLDRAVLKAQRNGTAIYSIYASASSTSGGSSVLVSYGQGSLNRLTDETGGRSFFQGTSTPVSFDPFLRQLGTILSRQYALTYLSSGSKKDLRRIEVTTDNPEIKIEYPKNYIPKN